MASLLELQLQPQTPTTPSSSFETYTTPSFDTASLASDSEIESDDDEERQNSNKHCGFTPYRGIGRLPRAWERKAATPFAPRSDGQRIWKRVPLAETQSRNVSGVEGQGEDAVKVVKKMRMDVSQCENDGILGDSIVVETKVEGLQELEDVRRKVSGALPSIESNTSPQTTEEPTITTIVHDLAEDDTAQMLDTQIHNENGALSSTDNTVHSIETEERGVEDSCASANELQNTCNSHREQEDQGQATILEASSDVITSQSVSIFDQDLFNISKDNNSKAEVPDTSNTISSNELDDQIPADAINREGNDLNVNNDVPTSETGASDSHPSGTLHNSERRRSSFFSVLTGLGVLQPSGDVSLSQNAPQEALLQSAASPNDDTAFLHAFLSRTRAQKLVRAQLCPEKSSIDKVEIEDGEVLAPAGDTNSAVTDTQASLDLDPNDTEANLTSPCRRSSRTRLPRPQKMAPAFPSSIPVRRSNGTEFIFLQKSESQEVAIATRVNTRRNKGDAQPPRMKLPQLRDPNYVNNLNSMAARTSPNRRTKRKEVSWNEAQLTEMYEIASTEPANVQDEGGDQTETVAADTVVIKASARKMRKLGTVNGTPAPKRMTMDEAEDIRVSERRLRSRARS